MPTIDELKIVISAEANKAVREIDLISKGLKDLSGQLESPINATGIKNVSKEISTVTKDVLNKDYKKSIKEFSNQFSDVGKNFKIPNSLIEVQNQIKETEKKLEKLGDKEERVIDLGTKLDSIGFKGIQRDISENLNKLDLLIAKEKELQAIQKETQKPLNITYYNQDLQERTDTPRFAKLSSESSYDAEAMRAVFGEGYAEISNWNQAVKELGDSASATFNGMLQNVGKLNSNVGIGTSLAQGFKSVSLGIAKTGLTIAKNYGKSAFTAIKKAFKALTGFGKSSKGIFGGGFIQILKYAFGIRSLFVLFNKLRQAGAEGFKNLAQYSDETNKSISGLMSALTQFKNSVATAFAPILNFAAPALTTFINLISKALNIFGQFMAALTGKTMVVQSLKVSQDYAAGLSDNLGGAEDNAKKTAKAMTTLGIDELNINSPQEENKNSSGGGASIKPSEMFETIDIPKSILDFADKIKKAWENADFTEIGMILGEKFNQALESINWTKIQETANKMAKSIASFLNGFIIATDWRLVGGSFAEALNTIFYAGYTFVSTFNWKQFGSAIANGILGFIKTIDIGNLSAGFSGFVKGIIDSITGFIQGMDWAELTRAIVTKVSDAFVNFDFAGIASSFFEGLGSAFGAVGTIIGTLISDAFTGAKEYFQEIADREGVDIGTAIALGIGEGIIGFISGIGTWLYQNVWVPFTTGFCEVFGIHSPAETMKPFGENILLGVAEGFRGAFAYFTESIAEFWELYVAPWFTSEKWIGLYETIKTSLKTVWNETAGQWITDIGTWWNVNVAPWFTKGKWSDMMKNIPIAFKEVFKGAANFAIDMLNGVIGGIESLVNRAIDGLKKLAEMVNKVPGVNINISGWGISLPRIPKFEDGGFPERASLFWSGEYGVPEILGTVGGKTAVAGGAEITGIRDAVYDVGNSETTLLRMAVSLLETIAAKDTNTYIDGRELVNAYDERKTRNGFSFT